MKIDWRLLNLFGSAECFVKKIRVAAIDLFCGVGGLTYGLEKSGMKVLAGIDLDDSCRFAYETNNTACFIHKSIQEIKGKELEHIFRGTDIRVLVGCAPCQPFSMHQKDKRNRKTHKDWGLLYDFIRIVQEISPHIVSMENVPELAKEVVFLDFVDKLVSLGYKVNFKIHDASDYGVPQRRRRLLLLASKFGDIDFIESKQERVTVRDAIYGVGSIATGYSCDRLHVSSSLTEINIRRIRQSKPGGSWKDWDNELLPLCYKKITGQSYRSVYGRMSWDDVAPTLTTQFINYGTGRFGHPEEDRAISLREGALLQSFPSWYQFVDDNQKVCLYKVARQIGNAVPPKLGEHIGKSILKHVMEYTNVKNSLSNDK